MTIDNDNDYDKGWLSSDDSPGCAFGSSDEFAGNKAIRKKGNREIGNKEMQLAIDNRQ